MSVEGYPPDGRVVRSAHYLRPWTVPGTLTEVTDAVPEVTLGLNSEEKARALIGTPLYVQATLDSPTREYLITDVTRVSEDDIAWSLSLEEIP